MVSIQPHILLGQAIINHLLIRSLSPRQSLHARLPHASRNQSITRIKKLYTLVITSLIHVHILLKMLTSSRASTPGSVLCPDVTEKWGELHLLPQWGEKDAPRVYGLGLGG